MTTSHLFEQWANHPTREGLQRVQDAVQAEPLYDAYRDLTRTVAPLLDDARYAAAQASLLEVMPAHVLSPGAHAMLARAHEGLGDHRSAEMERSLMKLTMQVILHSGDGSAARPYEVLATSDEYDVLEVLGLHRSAQASSDVDGRLVDVFTDADGDQVHFVLRGGGRRRAP